MACPVVTGGGAADEVRSHLEYIKAAASDSLALAEDYIIQLTNAIEQLDIPNVEAIDNIELIPVAPYQPLERPEAITAEELAQHFDNLPTSSDIVSAYNSLLREIDKIEYNDPGDKPDWIYGNAPTPKDPGKPSTPIPDSPDVDDYNINTNFDEYFPDEPTYTEPTLPTFSEITMPTMADIDLPIWDGPDLPTIDFSVPNLSFDWSEDVYTDDLYEAVTTKLLADLAGGTGFTPEVEQALFDRARNREDQLVMREKNQILIETSQNGFTLPTGVLIYKLQEAAKNAQDKLSSINRDIMIKMAELEQENLKFTVSSALQLENTLFVYASQRAERSLEAAKFLQTAAIELFKAQIQLLNAEVEIYKAYSQVFETRIQAEMAKVEVYKAELEATKLIVDIDLAKLQRYIVQWEAIKVEVDVYRALLDAVNSRINAEKMKLDMFLGEVSAYKSQIDAISAEYDLYGKQLEAARFPLDSYIAQTDAYSKRIQAYGEEVRAAGIEVDAEYKAESLQLDAFRAKMEGLLGIMNSKVQAFEQTLKLYDLNTELVTSDAAVKSEEFRTQLAHNRAIADVEIADAQLTIQRSQAEIQRALNIANYIADILKQQALVSGELASASLAALNVGAQISGSDSTDTSYNYSC